MLMRVRKVFNMLKVKAEIIYLLYFALMVGARALGMYEGTLGYSIVFVIAMLLFILKLLVSDHTGKEYLLIVCLLGLAGVVYLHSGEKGLIVCFATMLGMKGVSKLRTVCVGSIVAGCAITFKIVSTVCGIGQDIYYLQWRSRVGVMFRHSLGYAHPNTLHMNILMLTMMIIYILSSIMAFRGHNSKKVFAIITTFSVIAFGINYYIFRYSGSRTGLLGCLAYLILNLWLNTGAQIGRLKSALCYISFPGACFISISLPFLAKGRLYSFLNWNVFSTRFDIARYYWDNNSLSILGQRLNNPLEKYSTYGLDMSQLYLLLQLGIIAFIVIACLTEWYVHHALKREYRSELAVLLGMLFVGIWEPLLYNMAFKNFSYVFMGAMIYQVLFEYEAKEPNLMVVPDLKRMVRVILASVLLGILMSGIYLVTTNAPTVLYGYSQKTESGEDLGLEEVYFSYDEYKMLKENGDIFIGYTDQNTPMYKYDETIAKNEYYNRVIGIGLISATVLFIMTYFLVFLKNKGVLKKIQNRDVG